MKSLGTILSYLATPSRARNLRVVLWLVLVLVGLVAVYSVLFHVIMASEGRDHSWMTGVYWTLTVMSTLGFGDITFQSDLGRFFSVVVLVSGALFILVLLPFTFIQFVFLPWVAHLDASRAPRRLPDTVSGHILLTDQGAIEDALIRRADAAKVPYVMLVPDLDQALSMHDQGYKVMVGPIDDPDTYRAARVEHASLVAATNSDTTNANVAFTVREIDPLVPVVATATAPASVDLLQLAGCNEVLRLGDMLGRAIARQVLSRDGRTHVVGEFEGLLIAEASMSASPLVGETIRDADLRRRFNLTAVGAWDRGRFTLAGPDTVITPTMVLILAGSREELAGYDEAFGVDRGFDAPVIIIGGGRVGRAAGRSLAEEEIDYRIIERQEERIRDAEHYVLGDAAELRVLEEAGIRDTPAVLVTTHDDDINVYLTIYVRKLRPDVRIVARSNLDRNVTTLHRAGADVVLSYASSGATAIWNALGFNDTLALAEGLDVFRLAVPAKLAGRTLAETALRQTTGCNVVAVVRGDRFETNPDASLPLPADAELVIIGDSEAQRRFHQQFPSPPPGPK